MKLNGLVGKGTGKLGSSVFAISGGEQIVRQYNPNVSNPSTDAQVEQRAKLKLMSQLAAALAPGIAFKKNGLVSARNQFISANIGKTTFSQDGAHIELSKLDLTGGARFLPELAVGQVSAQDTDVALASAADANVQAVVYVLAEYSDGEEISNIDVKVVSTPGNNRLFSAQLMGIQATGILLAYGVVSPSSAKGINYDNYSVYEDGITASAFVIRKLISAGAEFTQTKSSGVSLE